MKRYQSIQPRRPAAALTAACLATALVFLSCGRKGPLRLEPRPEPVAVSSLEVRQLGAAVELSWTFPTVLGDGTTTFDTGQVRWVRGYHSDRILKGDQFQRRAEALRKVSLGEVQREGVTYRLRIPFSPAELAGKRHFFSLMYAYQRYKSPLAPVQEFVTGLPASSVPGLAVSQEGKAIRLEWKRPTENLAGKPLAGVSGYYLYRRIIPEGESQSQPAFESITSRPILQERYEDTDTSREGRYEYRVSALLSPGIESAPSDTVSITMTDTYPPDTPTGVVVFRARDHLLINWRAVTDRDLSHYRIYRRVDNAEEFTLLVDRVTTPHYEDRSVAPEHMYTYQVTAVDAKGNESLPSQAVDEAF